MADTRYTFPVICVQPEGDSDEHIHESTEGSANRYPYKQQEDEHRLDGCRQLFQGEQQPALSIKHEIPTENQQRISTSNHGIIEGKLLYIYAAGDRTTDLDSFNPSILKTEPAADGHLDSKDNIIGGSKHHVNRKVEPSQTISWVPRISCRQSTVKSEPSVDTDSITAIWVAQPATQEQQLSIHPMEHEMKSEEGLVISSYCSLAANTECKVEGSVMDSDHIDVKVENTEVKKAFVNKSFKIEAIGAAEQLVKASSSDEHVDTNDIKYDLMGNRTHSMPINAHSELPKKKATHKCRVCEKCFPSPSQLEMHMRIHTGLKPYQCPVCDKCFAQKGHLTIHTRIHSGERPYKCTVCCKSFPRINDLTVHARAHSGEKPYECSMCGNSFAQRGHLTVHTRKHTGEKPYHCSVCGKQFARVEHLARHKKLHTGVKPYQCSACGKQFARSDVLNRHKQLHTE